MRSFSGGASGSVWRGSSLSAQQEENAEWHRGAERQRLETELINHIIPSGTINILIIMNQTLNAEPSFLHQSLPPQQQHAEFQRGGERQRLETELMYHIIPFKPQIN